MAYNFNHFPMHGKNNSYQNAFFSFFRSFCLSICWCECVFLLQVCIFSYSHWQPVYDDIKAKWGDRVFFSEDIPSEQHIQEIMKSKKHGIYVADDKASEITTNPFFVDLLVRYAHHHRLSTCLIVQDASMPGKFKSVLGKNFHVNVLMTSPRDRGYLRSLGIMMNDYKCIMEAYDDSCCKPHTYLIVDTHPNANPQLKYRSQIFPTDEYCVVYQSKKNAK